MNNTPLVTEKTRQRREMIRTRELLVKSLSPAALTVLEDGLIQNFYTWIEGRSIRSIGSYWALPLEAPTRGLLESLKSREVSLGLPRLEGDKIVYHMWHVGQPLHSGNYGLLEPFPTAPTCMPDVYIIPLVAFDQQGHRLGYGKGHFDRYLELHPQVQTVGWAFDCQEVTKIEAEPHDQPLDVVITPTRILNFSEF